MRVPNLRELIKRETKTWSGWRVSSEARRDTFMGVETDGWRSRRRSSTLALATAAGGRLGGGGAGRGGVRTGGGGVTSRVASTAHMGVDACSATAAGCFVVVKTDQGTCAAAFPARVGTRAVVDAVVGAGADGTMGLSQAGEGDRPKFKVDRVPSQTDVAGGPTTKLFVVGEPSEALEFGNGRANDDDDVGIAAIDIYKCQLWVYILFRLNSVFLSRVCCISYSQEKQNDCIFWSKTKQPKLAVGDKNIFSSDLPSCWITGTEKHGVFTCRITKQNWKQIIPGISFTFHFEFSAQHTYSMNAVWN